MRVVAELLLRKYYSSSGELTISNEEVSDYQISAAGLFSQCGAL
jgi:hypothetical protein